MPNSTRGIMSWLLIALALAAVAAHVNAVEGNAIRSPRLIMGGYFYVCEWMCVVIRLNDGTWTVVDERGGWVHKEPVEFIPDP